MAIRRSAASEINRLVDNLSSSDDVTRQAAIARLTVIGSRAVGRLVQAGQQGSASARVAALTALEAIGDPRAIQAAVPALPVDHEEVAIAAVAVIRQFLRGAHGATVLDPLAAVVLDASRSERIRLAAYEALSDLPSATIAPLVARLRDDALPALRQAVSIAPRRVIDDPAGELERAARGGLPAEPEEVVALLAGVGEQVPLSTLHRLVIALREREIRELAAGRRRRWLAARGAAHRALATRKSRVALYDLRETLEQADRDLPRAFAEAATVVGDASCLEPLADAYARVRAAGGPMATDLTAAFGTAFRTIVRREHVGARHAALVRVRSRWPDLFPELRGRASKARPATTRRT